MVVKEYIWSGSPHGGGNIWAEIWLVEEEERVKQDLWRKHSRLSRKQPEHGQKRRKPWLPKMGDLVVEVRLGSFPFSSVGPRSEIQELPQTSLLLPWPPTPSLYPVTFPSQYPSAVSSDLFCPVTIPYRDCWSRSNLLVFPTALLWISGMLQKWLCLATLENWGGPI